LLKAAREGAPFGTVIEMARVAPVNEGLSQQRNRSGPGNCHWQLATGNWQLVTTTARPRSSP
jgi:hypothetical protein